MQSPKTNLLTWVFVEHHEPYQPYHRMQHRLWRPFQLESLRLGRFRFTSAFAAMARCTKSFSFCACGIALTKGLQLQLCLEQQALQGHKAQHAAHFAATLAATFLKQPSKP